MCEPEPKENNSYFASYLWPLIGKYKWPFILFLLGITLLVLGILLLLLDRSNKQSIVIEHSASESANLKSRTIKVDVEGAINKPGVYELNSNDRVEDAIRKAKGLTSSADNNWIIKNLNQAAKLFDGAKIYIPSFGEIVLPQIAPISQNSLTNTTSMVNLNTASQSDLEFLPGIGPTTAQRIIEGRPYEKIEDLLNKKIVGKSVFEKIKEKISVY